MFKPMQKLKLVNRDVYFEGYGPGVGECSVLVGEGAQRKRECPVKVEDLTEIVAVAPPVEKEPAE